MSTSHHSQHENSTLDNLMSTSHSPQLGESTEVSERKRGNSDLNLINWKDHVKALANSSPERFLCGRPRSWWQSRSPRTVVNRGNVARSTIWYLSHTHRNMKSGFYAFEVQSDVCLTSFVTWRADPQQSHIVCIPLREPLFHDRNGPNAG